MTDVILVDSLDQALGQAEKLLAHQTGQLHRAVSVILFNDKKEILLQQRAMEKYHSPGQWSNTCCTHPEPGQSTVDAASTRLQFEMGIAADLEFAFSFIYQVQLDKGLIEHEFDHVFFGRWNGDALPNPAEVMDWRWFALDQLDSEMQSTPGDFTYWLKVMWPKIYQNGVALIN